MFQTNLTGNCYGVASCLAAVAKELGYEPYVITALEDHAFVMIRPFIMTICMEPSLVHLLIPIII